jgi:acetyl esterase/lipase
VFYIHGGGMAFTSCFDANYRAWGKMIAHQGLAVMMVDFRNCLSPSSGGEVAPFPAGLNDCVSGFLWTHEQASGLGIDATHMVIAGESGGGNLSIATTMQLIRDGHGNKQVGLYSMCPYINGTWPADHLPSSSDNDGIFITVGSNLIPMGYGIEHLEEKNPVAWPGFATVEDVAAFPPTMVNVNECDPLRDEGIEFYRLLLSAGVKAHCRQVMGTMHAADLFVSAFPDLSRMTARDIRSWVDECRS